mmetsp:Transcript_9372/g.15424  ORF Transcript_9372/g.15424 Transcript_9372/m.15424 type:complete len:208 (+) Transcript_9372:487-1110(+)
MSPKTTSVRGTTTGTWNALDLDRLPYTPEDDDPAADEEDANGNEARMFFREDGEGGEVGDKAGRMGQDEVPVGDGAPAEVLAGAEEGRTGGGGESRYVKLVSMMLLRRWEGLSGLKKSWASSHWAAGKRFANWKRPGMPGTGVTLPLGGLAALLLGAWDEALAPGAGEGAFEEEPPTDEWWPCCRRARYSPMYSTISWALISDCRSS